MKIPLFPLMAVLLFSISCVEKPIKQSLDKSPGRILKEKQIALQKEKAEELRATQLFQCYSELRRSNFPTSVFAAQNRVIEFQWDRLDSLKVILRVTSGLAEGKLLQSIKFSFAGESRTYDLHFEDPLIYTERITTEQRTPVNEERKVNVPAETRTVIDSNGVSGTIVVKPAKTRTETHTSYLVSNHVSTRSQWYNEAIFFLSEADLQLFYNANLIYFDLPFEKSTITAQIRTGQLNRLKRFIHKPLE